MQEHVHVQGLALSTFSFNREALAFKQMGVGVNGTGEGGNEVAPGKIRASEDSGYIMTKKKYILALKD